MEAVVIVVLCGFGLGCLFGIHANKSVHKLLLHFRENHFEKWKELTAIPGGYVGFRRLNFLFGKNDLDDPYVRHLKTKVRKAVALALVTMLATFLTVIVLAILSHLSASYNW